MDTRSTHYLVELWDADQGKLDSVPEARLLLLEAARRARVTVLHSAFHRFNPVGVSGVVVIAESHITIHTWPEEGYAAVDIFTCGDHAMPEVAAQYLAKAFRAKQVEIKRIVRGVPPAKAKQKILSRASREAVASSAS
jgi:S-adenosylmethionine decarboxylase